MNERKGFGRASDDTILRLRPAPGSRQVDTFFDAVSYSAFPRMTRFDGEELLLAFRQAPREEVVRHTHPGSVITVIRSHDQGRTWDVEGAAQRAADA